MMIKNTINTTFTAPAIMPAGVLWNVEITATCPDCGTELAVGRSAEGSVIKCKNCDFGGVYEYRYGQLLKDVLTHAANIERK